MKGSAKKSNKGKSSTPKSKHSNTPNLTKDIQIEEFKSTSPERLQDDGKILA